MTDRKLNPGHAAAAATGDVAPALLPAEFRGVLESTNIQSKTLNQRVSRQMLVLRPREISERQPAKTARFPALSMSARLPALHKSCFTATQTTTLTLSRSTAQAALSSTTTTTAGWTFSFSAAAVSTASAGTLAIASITIIATEHSPTSPQSSGLTDAGWACGVCVGDYNNDGFEDLYLTYYGQNKLYRNNGDGTFTDVTREGRTARLANALRLRLHVCRLQPRRLLDLFVSNYVDIDMRQLPSRRCKFPIATSKAFRRIAVRADLPHALSLALSQQRRRNIHRCLQGVGRRRRLRGTYGIDRRRLRCRRRWLARYFCRLRFHAEFAVDEQS